MAFKFSKVTVKVCFPPAANVNLFVAVPYTFIVPTLIFIADLFI